MTTPTIETAYVGLPAIQIIPTNIRAQAMMSDTSLAAECFINQRFSAQLQAFLISYNNYMQSNYAVYAV